MSRSCVAGGYVVTIMFAISAGLKYWSLIISSSRSIHLSTLVLLIVRLS